jgi:hypothetical protein
MSTRILLSLVTTALIAQKVEAPKGQASNTSDQGEMGSLDIPQTIIQYAHSSEDETRLFDVSFDRLRDQSDHGAFR